MNRIKRIWILGILLIGAYCNSWLDVASEDHIMEKDLFEEREICLAEYTAKVLGKQMEQ